MTSMIKRYFSLLMLSVVLIFAMACSTAPVGSPFMQANLPSIETVALKNGVKLILKKNPANSIYTMKLVYVGGSALATKEKAGLEAITLAMLTRGSSKYSYDALQGIQYELSSEIGTSSTYDWSSIDLGTIDKYWDKMFEAYADCILNPKFDAEEFELVKKEVLMKLQKSASEPYETTISKLHEKMFEGHPYYNESTGTIASVSSITLDDVKNWYKKALMADRMFVVAVGNFDTKALVASLNKTIGNMPKTGIAVPTVPAYSPKQALYMEPFAKSKGIAYVRGDYPIPSTTSNDFAVLQFANSILNELLFSIVRTEHAACYSVWANAHGFKASYGSFVIYKSDQPSNAKKYFDESVAILASGKTLDPKSASVGGPEADKDSAADAAAYVSLESTIETYKAKFINTFFSNQQTNAETASQLASSYIHYSNPAEYLKFIDKIHAIKASDVLAVVNKYLVNNNTTWIVVSDQATLDKVDKTVFEKFTGQIK